MRAGRGRLVTVQAEVQNWNVLLDCSEAVASQMVVNNVFNFFLSCLSETLDENHSVLSVMLRLMQN